MEFLDQQDYQKVDKMEHLSWPQNCEAIFQPQNAGHISPRNLVKAQKVLAGKNNCQIISDALGADFLVFVSSRSLKTREKSTNWDN